MSLETDAIRYEFGPRIAKLEKTVSELKKVTIYTALAVAGITERVPGVESGIEKGLLEHLCALAEMDADIENIMRELGFEL